MNNYNEKIADKTNVILPLKETLFFDTVEEHDAMPLTSENEISIIINSLVNKQQWRDLMLFVVGINTGLRISDLLKLRFETFINQNGSFKDSFCMVEQKTSHTRATKKNRVIYINSAVKLILKLYLQQKPKTNLKDFLFTSEGNRKPKLVAISMQDGNVEMVVPPMNKSTAFRVIKNITQSAGIDGRYATHTLRKTFAYFVLQSKSIGVETNQRNLQYLQFAFGHSNSTNTLKYCGFVSKEISNVYNDLNLGLKDLMLIFNLL